MLAEYSVRTNEETQHQFAIVVSIIKEHKGIARSKQIVDESRSRLRAEDEEKAPFTTQNSRNTGPLGL